MNITEFQQDVLDRSQEVPIVVDFWAPWCGPCRFLGPVIEELAEEAGGRWELVKINVDESQPVSTQYQVMSIPAVKMFHKGKVVADFVGNLPKSQIQEWLQKSLPDPRQDKLEEIHARMVENVPGALAEMEGFVALHQDMVQGRIYLAQTLVHMDPSRAIAMVSDIRPGHPHYDEAEDIRTLSELFEADLDVAHPKVKESLTIAREALTAGDRDLALKHLIQSIMADKAFANELARRATIAIFHYLGEGHAVTKKHRPLFGMALY